MLSKLINKQKMHSLQNLIKKASVNGVAILVVLIMITVMAFPTVDLETYILLDKQNLIQISQKGPIKINMAPQRMPILLIYTTVRNLH